MTSTRFPRSALRAGVIALGLHGVVAASRSDDDFGRILAACGGIFVAGPIAWGMVADGCPGRGGKDSARPV